MKDKTINREREIRETATKLRKKLELAWCPETLYEKWHCPGETEKSAGQCGPSSVVLFEELQRAFPDETFSLAVGRVLSSSGKEIIIGKHVWVMWHISTSSSFIIDVTADQGGGISDTVICARIDDLNKRGIIYQAQNIAKALSEIDIPPKRRAKILRQKIVELTHA